MTFKAWMYYIEGDNSKPVLTHEKQDWAERYEYWREVELERKIADDHPLMVFAKECILGAYPESELADAAKRAINASKNFKETNEPIPCKTD